MKRSTYLVLGIVLVLVGLAGVVAVALVGSGSGITGVCPGGICGPGPSSDGSSAPAGVDAMFIEQMVPHHDDAIAMAELALDRAEHPELKQLAEGIKRVQTEENTQMRGFYREWFDSAVPTGRSGMMMGRMTDLTALEEAEDFDREFIEQMIPHHQMGIMMARMAGNTTGRTEIRELTDAIIRGQTEEIELMQTWYLEWYGR